MTVETYKNFGIDFNVYGEQEYSVQYCGDDFMFSTIDEARDFIDDFTEHATVSVETYKDYIIDFDTYDEPKYSVEYDDTLFTFKTLKEAIDFRDKIAE